MIRWCAKVEVMMLFPTAPAAISLIDRSPQWMASQKI
jgi:hypothetical protein